MRGTCSYVIRPALTGTLVLSVAALIVAFALVAPARAQEGPTLAIDANAEGNTADALAQRDVCIEAATGDTFQVDITAENVTQLSAWEAYMELDTSIVHVLERDVQLLLATPPGANPFNISESVPEGEGDDGRYRVGAANISEEPIGVDGSGVLARLTLRAAGPGVTRLSVQPIQTSVGSPVGPTLTDIDANHIGDSDGDSFFDGAILDATVAVDESCPADADGPIAQVISGDSDGLPTWVIAAVAVGIVAAVGFGGAALFRLRRSGSRGSS
jgi:hypothetical protein